MNRLIYLDNAATTQVYPEVVDAMLPFFTEHYGNPSAIYSFADEAESAVDKARGEVANLIGAKKEEIYFTGGGSESDNWALKATAEAYSNKGKHIITTAIEHHAILHTAQWLEKHGFEVTYVGVDEDGKVKLDELKAAIRPDTILISVMAANNEIGTIQPVKNVCNIAAEYAIPVHTDAVAAYGHIPVNVKELGVDYLSVSAHKIGGAKGTGFLYAKAANINPYIYGGGQEKGKRSGTENVAGIMGLAKAAEIAQEKLDSRIEEENITKNYITDRILREIKGSSLNGDYKKRISGNMNFAFTGINGGELVIMLDKNGICVSAGSACHGNSGGPSHVLKAIGLDDEAAQSSIRLTLGRGLTKKECDYCVECIKRAVQELRSNAV